MKKIANFFESVLTVLFNYIDAVYELTNPPYDPYGSIAYEKRFSYEDRFKISKAVDELRQNPRIKSQTLSLEKETITITINH